MQGFGLSLRGRANVDTIWPRISTDVTERAKAEDQRPIDLGTSENWLLREEIMKIYQKAIISDLHHRHLSYPDGLSGDQNLVDAIVGFFNSYFNPHIPVTKDHIATAPGAAFTLDALLYNICEPGDGLLLPTPCWNGFDWLLNVKAGVQPVFVPVATFDECFTSSLIPELEAAFSQSPRPIKGLLFTNPQNPLGQCYPRDVIEDVIKFCNAKKIHFISDEIYALSGFSRPDNTSAAIPFVSVLQLDIQSIGCNLSRVHTIWSTSKDFGSSGLRMGCCVTQGNKPLAVGMTLASNTQMSSLTAVATTSLLTSPELPQLLSLNSKRLSEAYKTATAMLSARGLGYIPADFGPFLFAKLAPDAQTWDDEAAVIQACKDAGVSVSAGKSYHGPESEKGWVRLNFAVPPDQLTEGLRRLGDGLDRHMRQNGTINGNG